MYIGPHSDSDQSQNAGAGALLEQTNHFPAMSEKGSTTAASNLIRRGSDALCRRLLAADTYTYMIYIHTYIHIHVYRSDAHTHTHLNTYIYIYIGLTPSGAAFSLLMHKMMHKMKGGAMGEGRL